MKFLSRILLRVPCRRQIAAGTYCGAYVPLFFVLVLWTTGLQAATPQLLGPALNVTSMAGQASLLTCVVRHIGDKTVSWIRQRDLAILSSGLAVYTSDDRIDALHPSNSDLWHLRIDDVRKSDQGIYECQVNTEPKLFAAIALIVLDSDPREQAKDSPYYGPPTAKTKATAGTVKIPGPPERTLNPGETASFICTANDFPELPQSLTWRHQGRIVGENARTKKTLTSGLYTLSSRLDILQVESDDDGDYECSVTHGPWASVRLHVLGGHSGSSQRMTRSSAGYLEGVSVKISENYRPPPKVSLPASLAQLTLPNIFADQYDFALELATLDQIRARRAALTEARLQRQDYLSQKLSKIDLQPPGEPEPASDLPQPEMLPPAPLFSPPSVTTTSNSILQPTVAAPKARPSSSASVPTLLHAINLAEFEGHSSSPFEDLELKTLNDKAELALLLQPTLPPPPANLPAPPPPVPNLQTAGHRADSTPQWSYGASAVASSAEEWWSTSVFQPSFDPAASTQVVSGATTVSLRQAKSVPDLSECSREDDGSKTRVKSSEECLRTCTPPPRLPSSTGVGAGNQVRMELDKVFDGLDSPSRNLVRQLADMGFPAARAARLVQTFKLDEKKVLDSLLFIQTMEEKGANALRVEKVLALKEEPTQEDVTQILDMTEQFLSLGFEEDRVLKAIVEAQIDRDRALDLLLS